MTEKQQTIEKYIRTQFVAVKLSPIGEDQVEVKDYKGDSMRFGLDDEGNIVDGDTNQLIARATTDGWENYPPYFG